MVSVGERDLDDEKKSVHDADFVLELEAVSGSLEIESSVHDNSNVLVLAEKLVESEYVNDSSIVGSTLSELCVADCESLFELVCEAK